MQEPSAGLQACEMLSTLLHRVGEASNAGTPGTAGTLVLKCQRVMAQNCALSTVLRLARDGAGRETRGATTYPHLPVAWISSRLVFPTLL